MIGQTPARWILLFGVLTALFFSGGEGIQLLPFPEGPGSDSDLTSSAPAENSKSYAFSVFSSRSYYAHFKSKFQKDSDQSLSGKVSSFEPVGARPDFHRLAPVSSQKSKTPQDTPTSDSTADRAPPQI
ncbi:MAG TPA: hypothetical protein VIL74_25555 [Pyrinomonadaceae bacterium]